MLWVVDRHAFRREAIVANLTRLGEETGLAVRDVENTAHILPENIADPSAIGQQVCLLGIGGQSLRHPDVVETIRNLGPVLGSRPLMLLVDRCDPEMTRSAREMGVRAIVETSMPGMVVLAVLEHVRSGAEYFPNVDARANVAAPTPVASEPSRGPERRQDGSAILAPQTGEPGGSRAPDLTERQKEVVHHVCKGRSNKVIARKLGVSEATVKVHIRHVLKKFNASNRTQIAIRASGRGLSAVFAPKSKATTIAPDPRPVLPVQH